jgi:hypothetical protein
VPTGREKRDRRPEWKAALSSAECFNSFPAYILPKHFFFFFFFFSLPPPAINQI